MMQYSRERESEREREFNVFRTTSRALFLDRRLLKNYEAIKLVARTGLTTSQRI